LPRGAFGFGFRSAAPFRAAFRRQFGMTPRELSQHRSGAGHATHALAPSVRLQRWQQIVEASSDD